MTTGRRARPPRKRRPPITASGTAGSRLTAWLDTATSKRPGGSDKLTVSVHNASLFAPGFLVTVDDVLYQVVGCPSATTLEVVPVELAP